MIQTQYELPTLYAHQETMRDDTRKALAKHRHVILQAPPGTGKTRLAKWMMGAYANREKRDGESGHSVFAVHRRGLVDNASGSFDEQPELSHGVIMSGVETYGGRSVQVASIDTLLSWFCEAGNYHSEQTYDFVTFDECHSHHSKLQTFLKAHSAKREALGLRPAFVLGLSATPQAEGLNDVYRYIVKGPATSWLVENGFLAPFRYFRATQGKLGLLVKRGDEYTKDSVCAAMAGLSGDLVRDWKQFAEGRPTVGFFPRLSHAREAQNELTKAGLRAEYVDGSTDDDERRRLFRSLGNGDIDYLCNVGVVERGTDIPGIECVQVCTAVGSVVRWLQMVGRGSRMAPSKTDCLILDHGGNIAKHGFFDDAIDWTLDWSKRPAKDHEARPMIECPVCQAIYRGGRCRSCGYEPTQGERKKQGLKFDGAELVEVKQRERAAPKMTNEQVMISALYACGHGNRTFRQAIAIAFGKAKKLGMRFQVPAQFEVAGHRYRIVPKGHADGNRRVRTIYGFTVRDHSDEANPYRLTEETR